MSARHLGARRHRWGIWAVVAGGGGLLVAAGVAAAVLYSTGRPQLSVVPADQALVQVHWSGVGARLTELRAESDGRPVAVTKRGAVLAPAEALAQGQAVQVTARVEPPRWLRWLLGKGVATETTVRTPAAAPTVTRVVSSEPGYLPVDFDHAVSVVEYRFNGQKPAVLRLGRPSDVADLPVPAGRAAGSVSVKASPLPWEKMAPRSHTVAWFEVPPGAAPVAIADPATGSQVAPNAPFTLTFSEPVAKLMGDRRPVLSPPAAGRWYEPASNTLEFVPSGFGFVPGRQETVHFDRPVSFLTPSGRIATAADTTSTTYRLDVRPVSLLRLEQILAQLKYLPLQFTPAPGVKVPTTLAGEIASVSTPLRGTFSWRWSSTPTTLADQWSTPGTPNQVVRGALMAFEAATQSHFDGYQADAASVQQLVSATWQALLKAAAAKRIDAWPYSYVYVTETLPETLTLWEDGRVMMTVPTNTGIPEEPTATGTYPIYLRFTVNTMSGTNPDGTPYDDIVYWINYFNGGDAVHGFPRASYGFPQSLGCVELPISTAAVAFKELAIGDLVTVA